MINQGKSVFFCAIVVAFGGFVFGLDAALISGTVKFVSEEFALSDLQVGMVVSSPGFGVLFALLVTGWFCNKYGRRQTLLVIAFLYVFSAVASVLSTSFEMLVAARFLGGLAFTSLSVAAMYIGEIAPPKLRGKLVTMIQINIVIGLSAAYFANYLILQASQSDSQWVTSIGLDIYTWRYMLGVEIVPAVLWFALLFFVPRSPRWLFMQDRMKEARQVLCHFMVEADADKEMNLIRKSIEEDGAKTTSVEAFKMLFSPRIRRASLIGLTFALVQQVTGINAIMFYAPTVFEQVGMGTDAAFFQAIIVGLVSVVFTIAAVVLVDRLGRRPLVIAGLATATISLSLCYLGFEQATYVLTTESISQFVSEHGLTAISQLQGIVYHSDIEFKQALESVIGLEESRKHSGQLLQLSSNLNGTLILAGIMGFIASFHFSIGPIMWVLFSEIFPTVVRGIAIPVFAFIASVVSYLVQQFFPWQLTHMGAANIFLFYAVCGVVGFIVLFKIMPETKNKSIEEIEEQLDSTPATAKA